MRTRQRWGPRTKWQRNDRSCRDAGFDNFNGGGALGTLGGTEGLCSAVGQPPSPSFAGWRRNPKEMKNSG